MTAGSTPLREIEEWPEEYIEKLESCWITTIEQVVGASATPGGVTSLAEQMGVSEEKARGLVSLAKTYLNATRIRELEEPVDPSEYGLGALKPND